MPAVQAPGELLERRRGRGQLEAHDRCRVLRDLGAGDLLEWRGGLLLAVGDQRVDEASLLAKPHHVPGLAQHPEPRVWLVGVNAAEPDVGVGGADRAVERVHRCRLAADVDRPLDLPAGRSLIGAADQLEREVRLPVAGPVGWPGADDVRDLLDHVLEVLALGLIVGGEVQLIQRIAAREAASCTANRQEQARHHEQRHAKDDQLADLGEQRERALAPMRCG